MPCYDSARSASEASLSVNLKNLVGTVVAERYRVQDRVGSGTMGMVYRAEHIHMKKTVALKILHPNHTRDPEVVERFQREAQAAANVEHPNICAATDFGRIETDFYYLVMEFLEGRTLIDVIKSGEHFGALRSLHIGIQMLSALERAHEMGVVHRDLKPENVILVERDGDRDFVKITDFGVAQVRLFKDAARLTQAGVVYGSPLYMSPQQAGGKEIDHRADLYSVGVMLYELLTGKLPFYAKSLMVVLNMHIADPPPPFAVANPEADIPREIEFVVMRLLAKEPQDRYQSAAEARRDLERIRDQIVNPKRRENLKGPANEDADRGRRVAFGVMAVLAALFVIYGTVLLSRALFSEGDDIAIGSTNSSTTGMTFEPQAAERSEEMRREFVARPDVSKALALLKDDPEAAIGAFGKIASQNPDNPHARFLLGRAHFAAGNYPTAFNEYGKAIQIESAYAGDSALQDDVLSRLEEGNAEEAEMAEDLLKKHLGAAANPRLAEIAEHNNVLKIRKRALRILNESGQFDNLPEWNQNTIQLRHAPDDCQENLVWVKKIADLGDPRALGALRRFSSLPKTGCGDDKKADCWDCLRFDLRVAIEKLESSPSGQ